MNSIQVFTLIESSNCSKYGYPQQGDDFLVINQNFVAVLDGASDVSGARYNGVSSGRFVVEIGTQFLENLAHDSNFKNVYL